MKNVDLNAQTSHSYCYYYGIGPH